MHAQAQAQGAQLRCKGCGLGAAHALRGSLVRDSLEREREREREEGVCVGDGFR